MIIDIHGHLGNINFAPFWQADADRLEQYLDKAGIDRLCVTSAKAIMYDVAEGNRELIRALDGSTRLLGYVTVNPMFPETLDELRYVEHDKVIGVKVHPDYHGYDIAGTQVRDFLDEVGERVGLILSHVSCMPGTAFAAAGKVAEFAARHPRTKFVLAHLAGIYQDSMYPYFPNLAGLEQVAALNLDNVWVDTAHYLMYVYPGVMENMVRILGPDRIVFGTDCPLQGPMQMRFALDIIRALDIADNDKQKILCSNATKLIGSI